MENTRDILLVEDSPDLALLLSHLLGSRGYRVHEVENGNEALAAVERVRPALVLLDVLLPGLDGWEVCRRIRSHGNRVIGNTPIVMLTVFSTAAHRRKAAALGVNAFIGKPFGLRELTETVGRTLQGRIG